MPVLDCQTEQHILDTAMNLIFSKGNLNATNQQIADEAGVNRTLINYYFRSKEVLIKKLMTKALKELLHTNNKILSSDLPVKQKTEKFIDASLNRQMKYPFLEPFITFRQLEDRFQNKNKLPKKSPAEFLQYMHQIDQAIQSGEITATTAAHFVTNLFSLMHYPLVAKNLLQGLLEMEEKVYDTLLEDRKKEIMSVLFS